MENITVIDSLDSVWMIVLFECQLFGFSVSREFLFILIIPDHIWGASPQLDHNDFVNKSLFSVLSLTYMIPFHTIMFTVWLNRGKYLFLCYNCCTWRPDTIGFPAVSDFFEMRCLSLKFRYCSEIMCWLELIHFEYLNFPKSLNSPKFYPTTPQTPTYLVTDRPTFLRAATLFCARDCGSLCQGIIGFVGFGGRLVLLHHLIIDREQIPPSMKLHD